ncbi:MAG: hypothetical protein ACE5EO_13025 [Candidatus Krumholzibacteriia bacterium]
MNKEVVVREALALRFKYNVLEFAREIGSNAKSYRFFEVPKATFYRWKKAYADCAISNWSFQNPFDSSRMTIPEAALLNESKP